jgi:hypothetical protein
LAPDVLEQARVTREVRLRFTGVTDSLSLASGALQITSIGGRGSEGVVLAYLPSAHFLWAGDHIQTVSTSSLYAKDVIAAAMSLGFVPQRFATQHVPLTPWPTVLQANPTQPGTSGR